jgi:hypothetical protein
MDARTKICSFCRKAIESNPVTVTARNGAVRHFHDHCSNIDRSSVPVARVIKLERPKR